MHTTTKNVGTTLAVLTGCLLAGCGDPCVDDGLAQEACPAAVSLSATGGAGDLDDGTAGLDDAGSISDSQSGGSVSATGGSASDSASGASASADGSGDGSGNDEDAGGGPWCLDLDGDGFGDPTMCDDSGDPPDGSVPNDDDCDDDNPNTFPGAAELDDPEACMNDDDDDGYGDIDPDGEGEDGGPIGGSDCDDTQPDVYACTSCLELFEHGFDESGVYPIDPDGPGGGDAFPIDCDMGNGGGWSCVSYEDFETDPVAWDDNLTDDRCVGLGGSTGRYLGGFWSGRNERDVDTLGIAHAEVWLRADYLTFESWDGPGPDGPDEPFALLDGARVWAPGYCHFNEPVCNADDNVCDFQYDTMGDGYLFVDVEAPHSGAELGIGFGADMIESAPATENPENEAWAVDNVRVCVR